MEKRHLANLEKLADFLENEITNKQFDISEYRQNNEQCMYGTHKHYCGTIGCAIGWIPEALDIKVVGNTTYKNLANTYVGCDDDDFNIGTYMFDSDWSIQSRGFTRKATIKRIREVVQSKGEFTPKMQKAVDKLRGVS